MGRYDNPILSRFLARIDCLKISALFNLPVPVILLILHQQSINHQWTDENDTEKSAKHVIDHVANKKIHYVSAGTFFWSRRCCINSVGAVTLWLKIRLKKKSGSWIIIPHAPKKLRSFQIFFKNLLRYSHGKVHHWYQWHRPKIWPLVPLVFFYTAGKFATSVIDRRQIWRRCQRHRWQIVIGLNNAGVKLATGVYDTGGKWWEQYQTAYYVSSQTKKLKLFWFKIFTFCQLCHRHRWCTLSCEYSANFRKSRGTVPFCMLICRVHQLSTFANSTLFEKHSLLLA